MNKQELLKQADYTFQRGNRALARKYLLEVLTAHSNDEAAWMLLARVEEKKERKVECYERVLKINSGNNEAKIGLIRINSVSPTLPIQGIMNESPWQVNNPFRNVLRGVIVAIVMIIALGTTAYVVARNNPGSDIARLIIPPSPTPFVQTIAEDIAAQTRAQVGEKFPQYAALLDALIGLAVKNAENGMDGAAERPGVEITPFEGAGKEARDKLRAALPQPGSLSSLTLDEQQITSWLMMELNNSPDLPLSDVQVYLREARIQIWGMVEGSTNSTSFLMTGTASLDLNGKPGVDIESVQIGQQVIPDILVTQAESWLNQSITDGINQQAPGLKIMNINISNGLITVSGMR